MGGKPGAFVVEARQPEIGEVLREVVGHMPPQHRQVRGGRDLQRIGQPRGIVIVGLAHPDLAGLGSHHFGEVRFGAPQRFGDHHGHVIGAADHDGADRQVHRNGLAGTKPQLGRLLDGGVIADRQGRLHGDLALLQGFEQQVEGHHLGERRRMAFGCFVAGVQHFPGRPVHHQGGILVRVGGAGGHAHRAPVAQGGAGGGMDRLAVLGGQGRPGQRKGQPGHHDEGGGKARQKPIR